MPSLSSNAVAIIADCGNTFFHCRRHHLDIALSPPLSPSHPPCWFLCPLLLQSPCRAVVPSHHRCHCHLAAALCCIATIKSSFFTIVALLSPCWCIIATAVAVPSPSCPRCRSHCAASPSPYHWIFIVIVTIVAVFLLPQSPFHHRFVTMSSLPQSPYLVIVTSSLYHCRRDLVVASLLLSHCHLHAIASTPSQLPYYCRRVVVMP